MRQRGTARGRFGGFAVGHLAVSLLGSALMWLGLGALDGLSRATAVEALLDLRGAAVTALGVLLMLLYVPAGYVTARARRWPVPGWRTGVQAVLYPGLCAWALAALGLVLMFGGSFLTSWGAAQGLGTSLSQAMEIWGMCLLLSTVIWASPSFFWMLLVFLAVLTLDLECPQSPACALLGRGAPGPGAADGGLPAAPPLPPGGLGGGLEGEREGRDGRR